jgi:hypothetical protein
MSSRDQNSLFMNTAKMRLDATVTVRHHCGQHKRDCKTEQFSRTYVTSGAAAA